MSQRVGRSEMLKTLRQQRVHQLTTVLGLLSREIWIIRELNCSLERDFDEPATLSESQKLKFIPKQQSHLVHRSLEALNFSTSRPPTPKLFSLAIIDKAVNSKVRTFNSFVDSLARRFFLLRCKFIQRFDEASSTNRRTKTLTHRIFLDVYDSHSMLQQKISHHHSTIFLEIEKYTLCAH